jgi:hypothetical protein
LYAITATLGGAAGLFLLYFGSVGGGDFVGLITMLGFVVLGGRLVLLFFPETKRRELESISH